MKFPDKEETTKSTEDKDDDKKRGRWAVTLFGRSVPVSVLLLGMIALTAFAGWLGTSLLGNLSYSVLPDVYGDGAIIVTNTSNAAGSNDVNPPGLTPVYGAFGDTSFDISFTGVSFSDQQAVKLDLSAAAGNSAPLFVCALPSLAGPDVTISIEPGSAMQVGSGPINPGTLGELVLLFSFSASLTPTSTIAPESVTVSFAEAGEC